MVHRPEGVKKKTWEIPKKNHDCIQKRENYRNTEEMI